MLKYSYYIGTYGGTDISENEWNRVSQKAEQRLNSYTFGLLSSPWNDSEWSERISCAICEMSELIYAAEKSAGKVFENNDGYSVSYTDKSLLEPSLYNIACVYLGDTGLLYAGVEEC